MKPKSIKQLGLKNLYVEQNHGTIIVNNSYEEKYLRFRANYRNKPNIIPQEVSIHYKLKNKELILEVLFRSQKISIHTSHYPEKKDWNNKKQELEWTDPFYFSVQSIIPYIEDKIKKNKEFSLECIRKDFELMISEGGLNAIAKELFNFENKDNEIPNYDLFIKAFELFSNLKEGQYYTQVVGTVIHFYVNNIEYEMNTYQGKTIELLSFFENRSYEEIVCMTDENIWSDIYIDGGMLKEDFVPQMYFEWKEYWNKKFSEIYDSVGHINHLISMKEESWQQFQIFTTMPDTGDIIKLSHQFDEFVMYPVAVLAMLNVFNKDVCFSEYCEFEFENEEWESIRDVKDHDSPIFYVREYFT